MSTLGPGRRPLVALLTKTIPKHTVGTFNNGTPETRYKWGRDSGSALLEDLFSDDAPRLKVRVTSVTWIASAVAGTSGMFHSVACQPL
jgi:hypothetical protein